MDGLIARDENLPGYAVGGLAGGEDKQSFWTVVEHCLSRLPEHKPRYVMGVGYPLDMVVCAALGADMYDCVYPTRTARFGSALVPGGLLNLKRAEFENDQRPVDEDCDCLCCKNYTRAFLHSTATKETIASQLLTIHNIAYTQRLTREMHEAILDGSFGDYVLNYMDVMYPKGDAPKWACDALMYAGIDVRNKRLLEDDEIHVLLPKDDPHFWSALFEGGEKKGYHEILQELVQADEPAVAYDDLDERAKDLVDEVRERQQLIAEGLIDPDAFDDFRCVIGESTAARPANAISPT